MMKRCVTGLVLLTVMVGVPRGAHAGTCTQNLLDCYVNAAKIDNFWYRTLAGIDCEIDYADCLSQALVNY